MELVTQKNDEVHQDIVKLNVSVSGKFWFGTIEIWMSNLRVNHGGQIGRSDWRIGQISQTVKLDSPSEKLSKDDSSSE